MKQFVFSCPQLSDTQELATVIGRSVKGGEVIELISDLGGGKTAFVKGLAKGLGVKTVVQSPTFTISQIHDAKHLQLYHYDFYRLDQPGVMAAELAESLNRPDVVTAIEWGEIVHDILPSTRTTVKISLNPQTEARQITVITKEDYLQTALKKYQEKIKQ